MLTCPACGAEQPSDHRFCSSCGIALSITCPECAAVATPDSRFCPRCGHPLTEPATAGSVPTTPASAPAVAVAERRICSVLFCDLVGFTPLSESRDPEDVRELLSRYFNAARTIVRRYGGVVEKFIGDAVMAVWGTPIATEEDAERAVRAALDIVEAVRQLGADVGADLAARAGVVTGEVAVTIGATGEGMVAGDAVNTAARVQSAATPGAVFVDTSTHRSASSAIGFTPAGDHVLKGKAEPQGLWQATRVLAGVGGSQRVDGLEASLVGRDAELRTIKELFHASAERKVARLVVVSGPAGVGKSRLGWEFEKYVDGLADTILWHRGRCLSYGEGVAYWALAEMFRQRLGIAEEESVESAEAKLADGLAGLFPDDREREYVGRRIAILLGLTQPTQPTQTTQSTQSTQSTPSTQSAQHVQPAQPNQGDDVPSRDELFAGWRLYIERLVANQPTVLLFEDAQHADSNLMDFVNHVIDWTRDLPIYVLVFTRPDVEPARAGFAAGRNRTILTLDPLDPASMLALVEGLVPNIPLAANHLVTGRAEGIPLFAVETIRSLIDQDIVVPVEGVYRLVGDIGELSVPGSLHGLLSARLDALPAPVRQLVADASVLGSTFPAEALTAISGRPRDSVATALAELVRREVLHVSADPLSPERGSYRFSQDMLRQVAYATLSRRDRKSRHLAVAAHLQAVFPNDGEEVADVIARHYRDALHAGPDDLDAETVRTSAFEAYLRAARRAERTGAPARAAANYSAAADLLRLEASTASADASLLAGLHDKAATASYEAGDFPGTIAAADRAQQFYLVADQARAAARVGVWAGRALENLGRMTEAEDRLRRSLAVLGDDPDEGYVDALTALANNLTFQGAEGAGELSAEGVRLAQDLAVGNRQLGWAYSARGIWYAFNGYRAQAAMYFREGARLAERENDVRRWGVALMNLADALSTIDLAGSAEAARMAMEIARRGGNRDVLAMAASNLAYAQMAQGDWDAALLTLTEAIEGEGLADVSLVSGQLALLLAMRGDALAAETILADHPDLEDSEEAQSQAFVAAIQAFIAAARHDLLPTLSHCQRALALVDAIGLSAQDLCWTWPLAARSAIALDDWDAVDHLIDLLDTHLPGQVAPQQRIERQLVVARLAVHRGDPEAPDLLGRAIDTLRDHSSPYNLAHGLIDHAHALELWGEEAAAGEALDEARRIGEELRCQPLLDRISDFRLDQPAAAAASAGTSASARGEPNPVAPSHPG